MKNDFTINRKQPLPIFVILLFTLYVTDLNFFFGDKFKKKKRKIGFLQIYTGSRLKVLY